MKFKLVFIPILFLMCLGLQAQIDRTNFRAGANVGLVVGDFSEAYSLNLGIDIYQHWGVSRELDLGIATGFSNAFGEKESISNGGITVETEFANAQFIPVAGSVRIYPTSGFKIGGDVGYAVGVNKDNQGGFYYRPTIGVDINGGTTEINVSYFAVNDDTTFSAALLGFLILF
ncbi:MAG: hypothetical protein WBB27_05775 [Maribacter sp.]